MIDIQEVARRVLEFIDAHCGAHGSSVPPQLMITDGVELLLDDVADLANFAIEGGS